MLDRGDVDYVNDAHSAARLHLELLEQRDRPGLTPGQAAETKAALNKLNRTWPEAGKVAAEASEDELGGLNPRLKRTRDAHRRRRGTTAATAATARSRQRRAQEPKASPQGRTEATPKPAPRTTRRSSPTAGGRPRGGPLFSGRTRRAFRQTGVPGAAGSATQFALELLGLMIGMALLYLVLRDAQTARRGRSVIDVALSTITGGVNAFIAPVDPLGPKLAPYGRKRAPGVTAGNELVPTFPDLSPPKTRVPPAKAAAPVPTP